MATLVNRLTSCMSSSVTVGGSNSPKRAPCEPGALEWLDPQLVARRARRAQPRTRTASGCCMTDATTTLTLTAGKLIALVLVAFASLTACVAGSAHQNFKNIMNLHVGKYADSPSVSGSRNPDTRIGLITLPNGNVEEAYRLNRTCHYYFEIDKTTGKIVSWRYEGSEQDCVVVP